MFESLLGRKKKDISQEDKEHSVLLSKIERMNLIEMRAYVKNNIVGMESSADGLSIVLRRVTEKNSKTSKRYIEDGDMDSKIKKAFELVLAIASHKKITVVVIEQIQEFISVYEDIIMKFDKKNKEIYNSRLKNAVKHGVMTVNSMTTLNAKMKILQE